ncbi:hypothetical protein K2173_010287 [Erythroxylum novogranatense]|uniref:Uncharacterized protein n=1 Tax=Erythroxylum novogranatense TaxID=1862640 RepID=A0AAV8TDG3_9ROSI|nr:hypothetical protein K2173_010287 [Erythroxylum novogranatense]
MAKGTILDILQDPYGNDLNMFLPFDVIDSTDLILYVQVTYFDCGGMVLGAAVSHKIADGLSGVVFLNTWAVVAHDERSTVKTPLFDATKYFPPVKLSNFDPCFELINFNNDIISRRFLFQASSINALRDRYAHKIGNRTTRIETLTAFACDRIMRTTEIMANPETMCFIKQILNLRTRMNPPLSGRCIGKYIYKLDVAMFDINADDACRSVIDEIRETVRKVDLEFLKMLQDGEAHMKMMEKRAQAQE